MKKLPYRYYLPIIIISLGFGILFAQYFDDPVIGAAIGMLVSMLMITEAENNYGDD
jgi:uncharacterized membrane protein